MTTDPSSTYDDEIDLRAILLANISVEAVPPEKAVSRKTLMNTALAGMLGLILSVFGALAMNWWRNE